MVQNAAYSGFKQLNHELSDLGQLSAVQVSADSALDLRVTRAN